MPVVPLNTRRVLPEAPRVRTPDVGGVVEGAFGEQVAKAQVELGAAGVKAGTQLLEHINRMQVIDEKSRAAIFENEFTNIIESKSHNTDTMEVDVDGKKYNVPSGYLDGQGEQTRNVTKRYKNDTFPLIAQYADKIKHPIVRQELLEKLTSIYSLHGDRINTYEATEWRKAKEDSFIANIANNLTGAASAMNSKELSLYIQNISKSNNEYSAIKGDGEEARIERQNKYLTKAIENAVTNVNNLGNPELAMKMLEEFKQFPSTIEYEKIKNDIFLNQFQSEVNVAPNDALAKLNAKEYGMNQDTQDKAVRYYNQVINQIYKTNEDKYTSAIVNGAKPEALKDAIKEDANKGLVSNAYALSFISKKPQALTELQKVIKVSELQERAADIQSRLKKWQIWKKPDFETLAKYRADVINAAANSEITESEMKGLLLPTTEAFSKHKVFDRAIGQLKGTSQLYDTLPEQAAAKAQMYGELYERIGKGEDPNMAALAIITDRVSKEATQLQGAVNVENKIIVIRKSDGKRVRIPSDKFNIKSYERIK